MIAKFEHNLVKIECLIAGSSLFLLLALSIFQIITRNFFDFGYPEIEIINRNLLVVCGAMGAVIATSRMRHIKVDALTTFMSPQQIEFMRCPLSLFSFIVCAVMSYHASIFVIDEWNYAPPNERWALPFTLIYPVGFALLGLHFLLHCFRKHET